MDNILILHSELKNKTYQHGGYHAFEISDPKPRDIHKAPVRDRLIHHAIYRIIYPIFDRRLIYDSYSCRRFKGTHKALDKFKMYARKASMNNTKTLWVLKCDVRKFFASIDHALLVRCVSKYISDQDTRLLISQIVDSFQSAPGKGLPLGNLTSQLLVNAYMNQFDWFIKCVVKARYYIRYADDFVVLSRNREGLRELVPEISSYLRECLKLTLHPNKISIKTLASGVDFLGWVHFPDHRVLRTSTKRRMLKVVRNNPKSESIISYLGMLKHGNTHKLEEQLPIA